MGLTKAEARKLHARMTGAGLVKQVRRVKLKSIWEQALLECAAATAAAIRENHDWGPSADELFDLEYAIREYIPAGRKYNKGLSNGL